jgi:UDP-glucose 4-epimerase
VGEWWTEAMRVVVTGGAGFVGLNIVEALINRHHDVILTDLSEGPPAALRHFETLSGSLSTRRLDVTRFEDLSTILKNLAPELVIHAAAVAPSTATELVAAVGTVTVNVCGTTNVLEAARAAGVSRVVLISSAAVYGRAIETASVLDEATTEPRPESIYGVTKLSAERLALRFGALSDLKIVRLRIGSVYGPWELQTAARDTLSPMVQILRLHAAGREAVIPRPGKRDWLYSADVGETIALLSEKDHLSHDLYNIGTGVEWTVADWCTQISAFVPHIKWRIAAPGEAANVDLFASVDRPPLAVDRLKRELGSTPSGLLAESVRKHLAWQLAHQDF